MSVAAEARERMAYESEGGAIRFGFKLPNCAGVLCEPSWAHPMHIRQLAKRAETLGYQSVWLHDHLLTPTELQPAGPLDFHEPLITAADVLARTEAISVGVATVVLPLREPVLLAKQIASLTAFSPDRFILGVGTGRYRSEFDAFGGDLWTTRGRRADEYLEIMNDLLTSHQATVTGRWRQVENAEMYPKVAEPWPIWVGGNSQKAMVRAARFGSGWIAASLTTVEANEKIGELERYLSAEGRDRTEFDVALSITIKAASWETSEDAKPHKHRSAIYGSDEEIVSQLAEFADAGVTEFLLSFDADGLSALEDSLEWFSTEVIPVVSEGVM